MAKNNLNNENDHGWPPESHGGLFIATEVFDKYGETKSIQFVDAALLYNKMAGTRIRVYRKLKGWSRGELAARVRIPLTAEEVRLAETRPRDMPIGKLAAICDALGKTLYDLTESVSHVHKAP